MDVQTYLDRIQAEKRVEANLDYLSHLQKQHVLNIHFENLDILSKKPLSLKAEDLYQKMVRDQHGGVCYELNGLFYHLLDEIGFKPNLMAGTVYVGNGVWALENAHMFIIVPIEGKEYLVDVGFGGNCPRLPVPLNGEEVIDSDGVYRVSKDESQSWFYLQKKSDEEFETLYRFDTPSNQWDLETIHPLCVLTETAPDSMFNKMYFLSRVTEEGRITLLGNTLIIVNGDQKTKQKLEENEIVGAVRQHFQLTI
ncbi:arylamine N-acetyltransferase [Paenibacillus sp. SC116]|uniref:arylamine N-acetyltransferase family protein n=1 Tax=Paenibacillus sp. SC116 TaxID=2968986 RepID=UPI00215AFD22|nr:arylamine N-acetyltransferase [Paenibacillus sp. SC116]MCR8842415.1 arylamine N-acetyltransferase [Paenibacillus sp. SC116]